MTTHGKLRNHYRVADHVGRVTRDEVPVPGRSGAHVGLRAISTGAVEVVAFAGAGCSIRLVWSLQAFVGVESTTTSGIGPLAAFQPLDGWSASAGRFAGLPGAAVAHTPSFIVGGASSVSISTAGSS